MMINCLRKFERIHSRHLIYHKECDINNMQLLQFSSPLPRRRMFLQKFKFFAEPVRFKSLARNPSLNSMSSEKLHNECKIISLDHLVLTVHDMDKTVAFYTNTLGMSLVKFGEGRQALQFGNQKINLHKAGREFRPHAKKPTPGSADLCFVTEQPLAGWTVKLKNLGITIEEGPVKRTGAIGPISSIYVRDPDENLIEIAFYGK